MSQQEPEDYRIALGERGDRGLAAFNRLLEKHQLNPELIESLRINAASRTVQNAAAQYARGLKPATIQFIIVFVALIVTSTFLYASFNFFVKKSPTPVVEKSRR